MVIASEYGLMGMFTANISDRLRDEDVWKKVRRQDLVSSFNV